jgi:protoporphyrinogen/coproporphyrinogen III oxidase
MKQSFDLAIVGAGFAGLAAAHFAVKAGKDVVLFEAADRVGGKALTVREHGFVVEQGPLGWLNREPCMLEMLEDLGHEPLVADQAQARRFLVHQNGLAPLPTGLGAFLRTPILTLGGRLRFMTEFMVRKRREAGDESVHDFATRRFGPQAAATLFEAFVSGVFAGDPKQLSVQAAFPLFSKFEHGHGSIVRGGFAHMLALRRERAKVAADSLDGRTKRGTLLSMPGGMAELADRMAAPLIEQIRLNTPLHSVTTNAEGSWVLRTDQGVVAEASEVILASPAEVSAQLLQQTCPELTEAAQAISNASLAVITFAFARNQATGIVDGFGFLAPRRENFRPLGVQFAHSIFPAQTPEGHLQLRVMLGGTLDPAAIHLSDDELRQTALQALRPILGLSGEPEHDWISRWQDVVPQYTLGHLERVAHFNQAEQRHPGLHFSGDSLHGVGVPAAFKRAKAILGD